jgi:membrane protein involved in colicin uptake
MKCYLTWLAVALLGSVAICAAEPENTSNAASTTETPQAEYANSLIERIERRWVYPKRSRGKTCRILVTQADDGEVRDARILSCDSDELADSVYAAVFRSSPLPRPADPAIFNPRLELTFVVPRD